MSVNCFDPSKAVDNITYLISGMFSFLRIYQISLCTVDVIIALFNTFYLITLHSFKPKLYLVVFFDV